MRSLKGANGAPTSRSDVYRSEKAGSPVGREPYGDGVPVVVRGRESRPHGEGGQVARWRGAWRYARCGTPKRHSLSSGKEARRASTWKTSIDNSTTRICSFGPTAGSTRTPAR